MAAFDKKAFVSALQQAVRDSIDRYRGPLPLKMDNAPCPRCKGKNKNHYVAAGRDWYSFNIRDTNGVGCFVCGEANYKKCPNYLNSRN